MKQCFVSPSRPSRLLLVDPDAVLRRGLAQMIHREPDLEVAGEATTPAQALDAFGRLAPDLALIDMSLRSTEGLQLVRDLRRLRRGLPVLLLTRGDDPRQVERALRAGARGVISKLSSGRDMSTVIRKVLAGGVHTPGCCDSVGEGPPRPVLAEVLTQRETEVMVRLGQGCDYWEIAADLTLSVKTIEAYLYSIRRKLDLPSRLALHLRAHALYNHVQEPAGPAPGSTGVDPKGGRLG